MDILLITASFFGYQKDIIRELESTGRKVMWFEDRPAIDNISKAVIRVSPGLLRHRIDSYFNEIIERATSYDIRDVLVIKGEALNSDMIRKMRRALPKARFRLYYWDSYRNMPRNSRDKVECFDKAFSFDPIDVANDKRLSYRPLFYTDDYPRIQSIEPDIDVLFLGTIHSDRYEVINRISRALPPESIFKAVMYMRSNSIYLASKLLKPSYWTSRKSDFVFSPVPRQNVMDLIARSRTIVDIERSVQAGYTMRTIEMLGASKKLITTNPRIDHADFFKSTNQLKIDRNKVFIPDSFLTSEWQPNSPELMDKYSIRGWLRELMD